MRISLRVTIIIIIMPTIITASNPNITTAIAVIITILTCSKGPGSSLKDH